MVSSNYITGIKHPQYSSWTPINQSIYSRTFFRRNHFECRDNSLPFSCVDVVVHRFQLLHYLVHSLTIRGCSDIQRCVFFFAFLTQDVFQVLNFAAYRWLNTYELGIAETEKIQQICTCFAMGRRQTYKNEASIMKFEFTWLNRPLLFKDRILVIFCWER